MTRARAGGGAMIDKPSNPTAEAMKKALAAKTSGGGQGPASGGFKPAKHPEKSVGRHNAALNKPAFRRASKRG